MLAVKPESAEAFMTELIAGFGDHDVKKNKFEVQDGYIGGTGYVLAQAMTGDVPFPVRQVRVMVLQTLNSGCHMQKFLLSAHLLDDCVPSLLPPIRLLQYTPHLVACCCFGTRVAQHSLRQTQCTCASTFTTCVACRSTCPLQGSSTTSRCSAV